MPNKAKLNRSKKRLQQRRAAEAGRAKPSQPRTPALSSSHRLQEDERASLEAFDGFAFLRNRLRDLARDRGEWAGIPMPLDGERLVVEPRYPNAQALMDIGKSETVEDADDAGWRLVNRWNSRKRGADILLFHHVDGRIEWGIEAAVHSLPFALSTLNCAEAWGIEQESNAMRLLGDLVSHRQMKQYLLTGMFMERSQRSGLHYLFRRLRPTVAITSRGDRLRILCALCMHPIAYYSGSWAGAMCPTDDVVAHLMMMRGDEKLFWKRSNQHSASHPRAGL